MLNTQEHYDLIDQFERDCGVKDTRRQKEPKELWRRGIIYCHGETNALFLAYRQGYAYGKARFQSDSHDPETCPDCNAEQVGPVPNYCRHRDGDYMTFLAMNNCD